MPFAENNGVRLHWDAQGEGTAVLLVMGHSYSSALWYPALPAFARQHRVITFDNRGTGASDTTRTLTVRQMAEDAVAVMDAAGVAKAHVYGVSMGGIIVQELAMRHPERVTSLIVGCAGMLTAEKPRAPAAARLLYHLPPRLLKRLLAAVQGDKSYGSAATATVIAADRAVLAKDTFTKHGLLAQANAMAHYTTTREAIAGLTLPALVLHGDEDGLVPFAWGEELAQALPNSSFVRLEGASHNFLVAQRDKANAAVLDFIRRVDETA
ncbi:MAG TPA: alpha/beta hydrolase [Rhizomicrobium sp.]|jgi:pimeloyl-ACP methyl ester carboxylesterase|nr:alpha/beta hydrolase [Rhizomicrobium sp.]